MQGMHCVWRSNTHPPHDVTPNNTVWVTTARGNIGVLHCSRRQYMKRSHKNRAMGTHRLHRCLQNQWTALKHAFSNVRRDCRYQAGVLQWHTRTPHGMQRGREECEQTVGCREMWTMQCTKHVCKYTFHSITRTYVIWFNNQSHLISITKTFKRFNVHVYAYSPSCAANINYNIRITVAAPTTNT